MKLKIYSEAGADRSAPGQESVVASSLCCVRGCCLTCAVCFGPVFTVLIWTSHSALQLSPNYIPRSGDALHKLNELLSKCVCVCVVLYDLYTVNRRQGECYHVIWDIASVDMLIESAKLICNGIFS